MHRRNVLVWIFLLFAPALWGLQLPETVNTYYHDWNFVALNSTSQQRRAVWSWDQRPPQGALSQEDEAILAKMKRIVELTERSSASMPMLLYRAEPPVTSEILFPAERKTVSDSEIVLLVSVMQICPVKWAEGPGGAGFGRLHSRFITMYHYTDTWTRHGDLWKLRRSPFVWVAM